MATRRRTAGTRRKVSSGIPAWFLLLGGILIGLAIAATGIPLAWSVGLVAAMCALLALSMLETALRILAGTALVAGWAYLIWNGV